MVLVKVLDSEVRWNMVCVLIGSGLLMLVMLQLCVLRMWLFCMIVIVMFGMCLLQVSCCVIDLMLVMLKLVVGVWMCGIRLVWQVVGWVWVMVVVVVDLMLVGIGGNVGGVCVVVDKVMGINMFSKLVVVEWIG